MAPLLTALFPAIEERAWLLESLRPSPPGKLVLFGLGFRARRDPVATEVDHWDCFRRFIQIVGICPVASIVELNTGEVALVKQIHHHVPLTPVVLLVKSLWWPC